MARFSGPDVVCCVTAVRGATFHHLYTQKAYPKLRHIEWNLCPVSAPLHEEFHKKRTVYMAITYPRIQMWLIAHDWFLCPLTGKWKHDMSYEQSRVR